MKDIFFDNRIYLNVPDTYQPHDYSSLHYTTRNYVHTYGTHNFKNGEDVTGRYELKTENDGSHGGHWETFAVPLPTNEAKPEYTDYVPAYLNDNFNKKNKTEEYEQDLAAWEERNLVIPPIFKKGDKVVIKDIVLDEPSSYDCDKGVFVSYDELENNIIWESDLGGTYCTPKERVLPLPTNEPEYKFIPPLPIYKDVEMCICGNKTSDECLQNCDKLPTKKAEVQWNTGKVNKHQTVATNEPSSEEEVQQDKSAAGVSLEYIPADIAFKVMNRFYPRITIPEFDEAVREIAWFEKMNNQ